MIFLYLFASIAQASAQLELHVDCTGAQPGALPTLHAARDALRAAFEAADAQGLYRPPARVLVRGPCHLHFPLELDARDSGSVEWAPEPPATTFLVSGGADLPAAWFTSVVDPAVLAQLPAEARGHVVQLDLGAHNLPFGTSPLAGRGCRVYAEGLPEPHGGSSKEPPTASPTRRSKTFNPPPPPPPLPLLNKSQCRAPASTRLQTSSSLA